MKNPDLYKKTVNILYQEYFNDTLRHGDLCACAVGNLVKHNMGYDDSWETEDAKWPYVFCTTIFGQAINPENYAGLTKKEIDSTGYSWQQLAKIEKAFETAPRGNSHEDWMFNGLVAVLEVLKEIHEIKDDEEIRQKFTSHHNHKINQPIEA